MSAFYYSPGVGHKMQKNRTLMCVEELMTSSLSGFNSRQRSKATTVYCSTYRTFCFVVYDVNTVRHTV